MTKTTHLFFASLLTLACSLGSATPCFANSAVTLNPQVQIDRFALRLSDLFTGVPAEIDRDIAQAPPACKPAVYSEEVLNKIADIYRLDWQPQGNADHAIVSSACARITGDMIRDALTAKLKEDMPGKERTFDISFDTHNLEIDLPTNQQPTFTLDNFSYDPTDKHFRADLSTQTPHGPYTVPVTGRVSIKRSIPILAHRLEAGTTIAAADLDWVQMPDERITADVITEADQLVGRELRRDTGEGDVIRAHDVVPPRMVLRGSLVTLKIQTPFILVTAQGKAQQDGAVGDVIRVTNTQSNRVIEGVVTGPDMVEIHTANKLASAE